jgi:TolA-binding protein
MIARFVLALSLVAAPMPLLAQDKPQTLDKRVERVEKELKAVQRKVFPGGDPAFFEPEIAAPKTATTIAGQPAGTPLNELSTRIDGLEQELTRLTAQIEQDEHRLSVLSQQAAKDRADFDARLKALEPTAPIVPTVTPDEAALPRPGPAGRPKPIDLAPPAKPIAKPETLAPKPTAKPIDAEPAPVATTSADPAEAAYMAGYNLWAAKKYPEAATALGQVVAKYPRHKRASYAQNLLGRTYLDSGKPALAAQAFATNYQTNPRGERAPDSLYFLGVALTRLNKNPDACKVYAEFDAAYGASADVSLKDKVTAGRKAAQCK